MMTSETELSIKWQRYFANIAVAVSKASKDPSIKHGAIIYRPDKSIASTGFNGLPRGIADSFEVLNNRELKYPRIVHAEANAIYHARENLSGYGMVVTGPCCAACSLAIIATGISTVYHIPSDPIFEKRWKEQIELSKQLFSEANVDYQLIK